MVFSWGPITLCQSQPAGSADLMLMVATGWEVTQHLQAIEAGWAAVMIVGSPMGGSVVVVARATGRKANLSCMADALYFVSYDLYTMQWWITV